MFLLAALVAAALAPLVYAGDGMLGDLEAVKNRGKLIMLCFPHRESLFIRVDTRKGPREPLPGTADQFQGIDVELIERFAQSLGVRLEVHPVEEPGYLPLIPALLAGEGDLIASSLSITPERQKQVEFSRPYYTTYRVLIVRQGVPIRSPKDIDGWRAAVVTGTSHHRTLLDLGVSEDQMVHFDYTRDVYNALIAGDAELALVDRDSVRSLLDEKPGVRVAYRYPGDDHFGIALRPGSNLLAPLNTFIERLERSGELEELIDRYR